MGRKTRMQSCGRLHTCACACSHSAAISACTDACRCISAAGSRSGWERAGADASRSSAGDSLATVSRYSTLQRW